ncbi:MAG: PAS domain S-box protein [Promethearchaeota archaeon]|jgi:PAS domain S-box-containing protein
MSKFDNDLKTSEKRYFNLINSVLDVLIELNLDLTITYINPQVSEVFGYSSDEIIGKKSLDFVHPDDISRTIEAIKRTAKTREIISTEIRIRHKKGYFVPTSAKGRLVEYDNQDRIVAILRDITEIKEAQRVLTESDHKYREIIENIEDGYFELDLEGNYTYINDYTSNFLGILKEDLIGKSATSILNKDTIEQVSTIFRNVYNNNLPKGTFESKVIRNDEQERTFEGTFYLRYDSTGNKIGFYGFTHDISERKMNEEKIRESEMKYREAFNRAELYKDLFYHDINNILSNIKLSIDLSLDYLNKPEKENEIKELYKLINNQFARGTRLIENFRKLSLLDNSEKSLKSIDAMKLLKDAINFIKISTQSSSINIRTNLFEEEIITRANELLIDIFDNLLINAVNYNENPKKEVNIKISRESGEKFNYIKFEFIDNGIGIPNKRKEIIFQEGFSKEKGSKGMGFGLTLVKKIIEGYNGKIWIEDRIEGDYSQGSNFVFLIPEAEN